MKKNEKEKLGTVDGLPSDFVKMPDNVKIMYIKKYKKKLRLK
ncbi:MAG: hypothetical protein QXE05_12835 [Nitrososphaeria archaeon]